MNTAHAGNSADRSNAPARGLRLMALLVLLAFPTFNADAQTFTVLHSFQAGADGYQPYSGVTIDQGGNLYGTTSEYDGNGPGTVYRMTRRNGSWLFAKLNNPYGQISQGRVVFGSGGALYGTTQYGGDGGCTELGCGSVYSIRAPQTFCGSVNCVWPSNQVYTFPGSGNLGNQPGLVDPAFDAAGNIYGTTIFGGTYYSGNVFELTRSNGVWTATSIHNFHGEDGYEPQSGVIFDTQGNIYGTAWIGGPHNNGTVYRLVNTGSGWTEQTLYDFPNAADGSGPAAALVMDAAGNLYGATFVGGVNGGGTVFELSPAGGGWNFRVLYSFTGQGYNPGPLVALTLDASGNLYGTTFLGGAFGLGSVFKLTHNNDGTWTMTDLHDFTGGSDGKNPASEVSMDANGNLFGTASAGASNDHCIDCGTVWEITP